MKKVLTFTLYLPMFIVLLALIVVMWVNTLVKFPAAFFFKGGAKLVLSGKAFAPWYKENVRMTKELIDWQLN
jgi:hypothetical protein